MFKKTKGKEPIEESHFEDDLQTGTRSYPISLLSKLAAPFLFSAPRHGPFFRNGDEPLERGNQVLEGF